MKTDSQKICILLATFNGGKYIREQIESVQNQSVEEWMLLVRDDGSTDETVQILEQLAAADPRISILDSSGSFERGATKNFDRLMAAGLKTQCNLFFLCDQDDIWDEQKLAIQSCQFSLNGSEPCPLLVHSDLTIVDADLQHIHSSLVHHMALEVEPREPLTYLLTRNYVTGCATAFNRRLLEEALPISDKAIMHDWWLASVAAATGSIKYIAVPLVKYRQHAANTIGAKGFWYGLNPLNNWIKGWKAGNGEFLNTFNQVEALNNHAEAQGSWPEQQKKLLNNYLQLFSLPAFRRIGAASNLRLRQGSFLLQLIYYIRLMTIAHR